MKARHIPADRTNPNTLALCGRVVKSWRRAGEVARVAAAYDNPLNVEGACGTCVARLKAKAQP